MNSLVFYRLVGQNPEQTDDEASTEPPNDLLGSRDRLKDLQSLTFRFFNFQSTKVSH
jgi:hypothetical protein